jgi:hypothetical protein
MRMKCSKKGEPGSPPSGSRRRYDRCRALLRGAGGWSGGAFSQGARSNDRENRSATQALYFLRKTCPGLSGPEVSLQSALRRGIGFCSDPRHRPFGTKTRFLAGETALTVTPITSMHLRVKEAHYVPRYRVAVTFNDGTQRVVDFEPFLKRTSNPMFTQYRRLSKFTDFRIEHGDLMWGDFEMLFPVADLYRGKI